MATLFRRILVPYDFSPPATRALKTAAELAAAHRGRLAILHVVTPFFGEPDDIAWGAVYLASDESRYVTGVLLPIDGGATA